MVPNLSIKPPFRIPELATISKPYLEFDFQCQVYKPTEHAVQISLSMCRITPLLAILFYLLHQDDLELVIVINRNNMVVIGRRKDKVQV